MSTHSCRHRWPRLTSWAAAGVLLAGCAGPGVPVQPAAAPVPAAPAAPVTVYVPVVEPADQAARHLLAYQERTSRAATAELAQEFARVGDGSGSPQATMELAVLLGHTRNPADLGRALALLEALQRDPAAQPWHGLARWLAQRYAEQRRLEEQAERLAQQLRDTQRDNQRRVEQLTQQLEALKAIERSLNTRVPAAPAHKPQP